MVALGLQRQQLYGQAIAAYAVILAQCDDDWEVAHMRAVSLYQLGSLDEARDAFANLLVTPAVQFSPFWTNLGLLLAAVCGKDLSPLMQLKVAEYRRLHSPCFFDRLAARVSENKRIDSAAATSPTVSVVLPTCQHRSYVAEAIVSVFAQTVAPLELIVIDDGSTDGTAEVCRATLAKAAFPVTFIARENRGAAATLNQGIEIARGEFIQLLNSDDRLSPDRIARMLQALLAFDADWGYARVAFVGADGRLLGRLADQRVAALTAAQDAAVMSHTRGLAMLRANSAISSGNLMFRKRLWQALGGFHDYRYNHDWDFCLRACLQSEPVAVPQTLYEYRIHGRNTISESAFAARAEQRRVMAAFISLAQSRVHWPNRFAPTLADWGGAVLALIGATDNLASLPVPVVEKALRVPLVTSIRQTGA